MALAIGSRLGPYEIVAAIGAGGKGEVYRARDIGRMAKPATARRLAGAACVSYRFPCLVLIAICALTAVDYAQQRNTNDRAQPSIAEILSRAGNFVRDAATQMRNVIADEAYIQELFGTRFTETGQRGRLRQRRIQSEALFLWLPAASGWMFVRNAVTVDGRPVPDNGERLDRLFNTPDIDPIAYIHKLQEENARFDLGPVIRTLGDPTLTLRFLGPESQTRFAFNRVGTERIGTTRATMIAYRERTLPTVVQLNGANALSSGTMWVDAADGTVMRTDLRFTKQTGNGIAVSVTVDFRQDTHLHAWVPSRMSEQYNASNGETLIGSASYTNFRKFDTSVRVSAP